VLLSLLKINGIFIHDKITNIERKIMSQLPNCPKCGSEYTYKDGNLYICPECANEWSQDSSLESNESDDLVVKDANGTLLQDGDDVTVIKDLKVKGSSSGIKVGTKIKGIRLVEGSDGHNIDCKVPGVGAIKLKQEFVKKS
jgi:protein PhnA